jgi:hypothetical protein
MPETIDLLEGLDIDHTVRCGADALDLHILTGDQILTRAADTAHSGDIVIVTDQAGRATLARHYPGVTQGTIVGVVAGVFRRLDKVALREWPS